MEKEFTDIYKSKHWGNDKEILYDGSSGPGSEIWYNIKYIQILRTFIIDNDIKTIVDLGCGNCKCLRYLYDTLDVVYVGYDVYKDIIDYNLKFNANDKYYFNHLDFCENKERIFKADLCIIKDVLMHWKLNSIYEFLDYLVSSKKYKHIYFKDIF
jgi:SAM-dependent methyltransferase